jgi:hypothetical protein
MYDRPWCMGAGADVPEEARRRADDHDDGGRDTQEQQRREEARQYPARSPGGGCALRRYSHVRANRSLIALHGELCRICARLQAALSGGTPATRQKMSGTFLDALSLVDRDAREWASRSQFEMAADLIPEPDAWALLGLGEDAELVLIANDSCSRSDARRHRFPRRRGLPSAEVTELGYRREDQRTFWHFKFRWDSEFRSRAALPIEGRIDSGARREDPETVDQPETLAACEPGGTRKQAR